MNRYTDRPYMPRRISYAAKYEPGAPLDDLLAVARMEHHEAAIAEVPDLQVLVVRYWRVPDNHPARIAHEVVEAGHFLVYSETFDLLYSSDPVSFAREHDPTRRRAA